MLTSPSWLSFSDSRVPDVKVRPRSPLTGPIGTRLWAHRQEVRALASKHGPSNIRVFGSVVRGEETDDSDVDLLVDIEPEVGLIDFARAQQDLELLLGAKVDLVPAGDLKPGARFDRQRLEDIVTTLTCGRPYDDFPVTESARLTGATAAIRWPRGREPAPGVAMRWVPHEPGRTLGSLQVLRPRAVGRGGRRPRSASRAERPRLPPGNPR